MFVVSFEYNRRCVITRCGASNTDLIEQMVFIDESYCLRNKASSTLINLLFSKVIVTVTVTLCASFLLNGKCYSMTVL